MKIKERIAIFPGSFDPYTVGHHDLILRAYDLFDKIIIAIGVNSNKEYHKSLEERLSILYKLYENSPKIEITSFNTLTINLCEKYNAKFILRGLRSSLDFEYEKNIAQMNFEISNGIESIFLISKPKLSHVSSTIVREISKYGHNIDGYLPK